jgi:hypothetical protein
VEVVEPVLQVLVGQRKPALVVQLASTGVQELPLQYLVLFIHGPEVVVDLPMALKMKPEVTAVLAAEGEGVLAETLHLLTDKVAQDTTQELHRALHTMVEMVALIQVEAEAVLQ